MPDQFQHGYALLIAVDQNQTAGLALPAAALDVAALRDVLVHPQRCAYLPQNVRLVQGEQASRTGILQGLAWLRDKLNKDPQVTALVTFSGHGGYLPGLAEPYLVPYDTDDFNLELSLLPAKAFAAGIDKLRPARLLVALDCCHAGGMGVKEIGRPELEIKSAAVPAELFKGATTGPESKSMEGLAQGTGRAVLSSSQGEQPSYVRRDGTMSIFTYHLIEALTGHAEPKQGASEVLVSDVISHVHRRVPASARADWNQPQTPDVFLSGNFPLALLLGGKGLGVGEVPPSPIAGGRVYQAQVSGSNSTVVQGDGNMVVGAGGVLVGGKVSGDVVTGQTTTVSVENVTNSGGVTNIAGRDIHQTLITPDPRQVAAEETEKARRRYLDRLRRHCQALPLAALGGDEGADDEITLERVYIDLDTTTPVEKDSEDWQKAQKRRTNERAGQDAAGTPDWLQHDQEKVKRLSVLAAAAQNRRLALLGDPGSGKSTFVNRLIAWLCSASLDGKEPPPGLEPTLTPVLVALRDLAARLGELSLQGLSKPERDQRLLACVRAQLADDLDKWDAPGFQEGLLQAFNDGNCLLVLDGLDEAPYEQLERVRAAVLAVTERCRPRRILVTCRIRSYTGEAVLPGFQAYTLAPFDKPKIEQFAKAWYRAQNELGRVDLLEMERKAVDLTQVAQGHDLLELAENPMLLTSMAIIHQKEIGLPSEKVRLYHLVVDVLLRRWQTRKAGEQGLSPDLAAFLRDDLRLRETVELLAYAAHASAVGEKKAADLPRGEALTLLDAPRYLGSLALAGEFLAYIDQRAGLLVGRGGESGRPAVYSFPHRTFQEYLAGCYLVKHREAVRLIAERAAEGEAWRLAVLLGAEDLRYNRLHINGLLDLIYQLCPGDSAEETAQRLATWVGELAVLAGAETIEQDTHPSGGAAYLARLRERLVSAMRGTIRAPERAGAGRSLACLGDLRPEVLTCAEMEFCHVPAGPFWLGSEKADDKNAYVNESPLHPLELPAYWMGRYPVTQTQYAEFVQAGGYRQAQYWPEAQAQGNWTPDGFKGRGDNSPRLAPVSVGEPFDLPSHPVVGISWYEALAFTRWLNDAFAGSLVNWRAGLPGEAAWEKAARGGEQIPVEGLARRFRQGFETPHLVFQPNPAPRRIYPWGRGEDPDKANFDQSRIGSTSAVGCFPGGASPYGCLDMSGNVWEWTRSLWDNEYPYNPDDGRENLSKEGARVVRGGSFGNESRRVRCAVRYRISPDVIYRDLGFRVCLPPSP